MGVWGSTTTGRNRATTNAKALAAGTVAATVAFALEPRFMFDAAGAATAAENADQQAAEHAADSAQQADAADGHDAQAQTEHAVTLDAALATVSGPAYQDVRPADPSQNDGKKEVVFVESNVDNYQTVIAGVKAGVEVVVLDAAKDGLTQMADWSRSHSGYDAIHVITHGAEGRIDLGTLNLDTGAAAARSTDLAAVGQALTADGDLLLYGCSVASGDGEGFIAAMAARTGADVAASDDLTGPTVLGGDWTLERTVGDVDVAAFAIDAYDHLLASTTFDADDLDDYANSYTKTVSGQTVTFAGDGSGTFDNNGGNNPSYGHYMAFTSASSGQTNVTISITAGFTFDISSFDYATSNDDTITITVTYADASTITGNIVATKDTDVTVSSFSGFDNSFPSAIDDVIQVVISTSNSSGSITFGINNVDITDVKALPPLPAVTDANIAITSTGTGTGGAYKIGDTVTATWDNTSSGDSNSGITGVTMNFSQFGGGTAITATDNGSGLWTASYVIAAGSIDQANRNVSVTALNGSSRTTADSTNVTVDNAAPGVTTGQISLSGGTGTGGVFKVGDTVTATWNNTAGGDNNTDVAAVTMNLSDFGGGSAVTATEISGTWTATYVIASGSFDAVGSRNASVTVTDDAGNVTTTAGTDNATIDNVAPTFDIAPATGSVTSSGFTPTASIDVSGNIYYVVVADNDTTPTAAQVIAGNNGSGAGALASANAAVSTTPFTTSFGAITSLTQSTAYDVYFVAVDASGNQTAVTKVDVTTAAPNANPVISNLNGDTQVWPQGTTTFLDDFNLGIAATVSDAENNGGNWNGATLTIARSATGGLADGPSSADVFGFSSIYVSATPIDTTTGTLKYHSQGAGQSFASYTNTGGTLTITMNSNATSEMVGHILDGVTYQNDTPAGTATITFALTDGSGGSTSASTTVTTNTIYVTNMTDTATVGVSDGVSLSEAIAIANNQSGTQTLILGSGFASGTRTLAGNLAVDDDVIVDADAASGMILSGNTITVASGKILTFTNGMGDTLTVASVLADGDTTSALAKTGAGTVTLTGTNTGRTGTTSITGGVLAAASDDNLDGTTGTGTITINGGTLEVSTANNTINNAVTIGASGGTISVNLASNAYQTFSGTFTSAAGKDLTKTGTGNLQLTGATNSTNMLGGITVNAGTLFLLSGATDAMLAAGTITLNGGGITTTSLTGLTIDNAIALGGSGGTVTINGGNVITLSGIISGGALTKASGGTLVLSGANTYSGGTTVSLGTLRGTSTSLQGNIANSGTVTFDQSADGTYAGAISGSGALTKSGANKLTLTGANTYTGATTISAGTLELNNASGTALADSSAVTVTGTLLLTSATETIGTLSGAGTVTLGANTLTVDQTADDTFSGTVGGTGTLAKTGSSKLTLSGTNNGTAWHAAVSGGTLSAGAAANLGTGAMTLDSGTLEIGGDITHDITLGAGGGTISNNVAVTLSGVISGSGGLTKAGSNVLTLSGNNSYDGATTISTGKLKAGHSNALGSTTGATTVASGASLGLLNNVTIAEALTISGTGYDPGIGVLGAIYNVSGTNTLSGTITLAADAQIGVAADTLVIGGNITGSYALTKSHTGTLALSGTGNGYTTVAVTAGTLQLNDSGAIGSGAVSLSAGTTLALADAVSIARTVSLLGAATFSVGTGAAATLSGAVSGSFGLTKAGAGSLTLSGANSYTGATTISAGTLVAANATALGTTAAGTTVADGATLGFGGDVIIGAEAVSLTGSGVGGNGALVNVSGTNSFDGAVTVTGNSTIGATAGTLTLSGVIGAGSNGLSTTGAGTIILSGFGSTVGGITVNSGITYVIGSVTSGVTVAGTLGGTGTITGNLSVVSGGTLAPGMAGNNDGAGKLTVAGDLTIASGGTLAVDMARTGGGPGQDYDQVEVSGAVDVTGATVTAALGYAPGTGESYVIINKTGSGSITGNFNTLAEGGTVNSTGTVVALTASYTGSSGNDFTLTAPSNTAPVISDLNTDSVAWAGVGNYVALDDPAGTALSVTDAEFAALNSGNGDWNGATLTISRVTSGGTADGTTKDLFTFLDNGLFTVDPSGNTYTNYPVQTIEAAQAAGQNATGALNKTGGGWFARWSYTYATGTLVVEFGPAASGDGDFNETSTTALVQAVLQSIGYRNDTPYGDTTVRFSLSDGVATGTADVTVTSSTIYVDSTTDADSEGDAGDGFSLREALARSVSQTGADTITVVLADNSTYTLSSAATAGAGDTLNLTGANGLTITGSTLTLGGSLTITNDTSKTATIGSEIAGSGMALTKSGDGTLTLSGANTYTGLTTVSAGTLSTGSGAIADTAAVSVMNGGTLSLGANETIGSLTGVDGSSVTLGAFTLTTGDSGSTTFAGVISGTGGLTKVGSGTMTLTGGNTYTGDTTVSAGGLTLGYGGHIDDASAVTVAGTLTLAGGQETIGSLAGAGSVVLGQKLTLGGNNSDTTFSGVISGSGNGIVKTGTGTFTLSGANTYTGSTTVSAGTLALSGGSAIADASAVTVLNGGTLSVSGTETVGSIAGAGSIALVGSAALNAGGNNTDTEFSGNISGSGGALLTKQGSGTLTLSGTNTHNGGTAVSGGTLVAGSTGALGPSVIDLNAGTTLSFTVSGSFGTYIQLYGAATINVGSGYTATLSNTVSGNWGITKTGTGTLALATGASPDPGTTTVSAGTLLLTGGGTYDGAITVNSGATLAGDARLYSTLTIDAGGTLAPGVAGTNDGAGTITLETGANLVLNGTLKLDLAGATAGTGYDQVVVKGGTVTLGANSAFDVTYSVTGGSNTFVVIDHQDVSAVTGTLNGVAEGGLLTSNSRSYKTSYVGGTGNDVTLQDNSPPSFTSTQVTAVNEDAAYTYTVTTSDGDGDTVTVTATTLPSWLTFTNGVLSGTPTVANVGTHSVVLTASDGNGGTTTQTFTITVTAVNDAPVITTSPPTQVNEDSAYSYTMAATDEEGQAITYAASALPSWMTFNNGVLSGTPSQADVGTHTVTLTATDAGGAVITQTFTITVNGVNDAPVITSTPVTAVNEDSAYSYTPAATDEEGQTVTFTATTLPSWMTFTNGVLSGTPTQADVGTHTVVLTGTDAGGATTTQSFTITVAGVNDAPVMSSTPITAVNQSAGYSYIPAATDEEGQTVTFTATTLPAWMTFTNGVLSGTPGAGDSGSHTVVLTGTDAGGATVTQSFTVTVNGSPATASTPVITATQASAYTYAPVFTDPEGQTVTVTATTLPAWLTFSGGVLNGTPGAGDVGSHTVVLTATDSAGATLTQTFTVTVTATAVTDVAPSFTSSSTAGLATADQPYSFAVSTTDPTNDARTITASGLPSWMTLVDNGNGTATLSGTPGQGNVGSVTVTLTVTDARGASSTQALSIAVSSGTTTNITQTTSTTSSTSATSATSGSGTGSSSNTAVSTSANVATPGGSSDVGGNSSPTLLFGNVQGNASSTTGVQQTQGLTTSATSGDSSASSDGSTLVRNAARGDSTATSSFYGAGTVISSSILGPQSGAGTGLGGFGGNPGGFGGSSGGFGSGSGTGGGLTSFGGSFGSGIGSVNGVGAGTGAGTGLPTGSGTAPGSDTRPTGTGTGTPAGTGTTPPAGTPGGTAPPATGGPPATGTGTPPAPAGQGSPPAGQDTPQPGGQPAPPDAAPQTTPGAASLPFDGTLFGLFGTDDDGAPHTAFSARLAGITQSFNAQSARLDAAMDMLDRAA